VNVAKGTEAIVMAKAPSSTGECCTSKSSTLTTSQ
jgi:hypothetical protein